MQVLGRDYLNTDEKKSKDMRSYLLSNEMSMNQFHMNTNNPLLRSKQRDFKIETQQSNFLRR